MIESTLSLPTHSHRRSYASVNFASSNMVETCSGKSTAQKPKSLEKLRNKAILEEIKTGLFNLKVEKEAATNTSSTNPAESGDIICAAIDVEGSNVMTGKASDTIGPSLYPPPSCNSSSPIANPGASWKSITMDKLAHTAKLDFLSPNRDGNTLVLVVAPPHPPEAIEEGKFHFEHCLVGYFLTSNVSFYLVKAIVEKLWGKENLLDVSTTEDGYFFFRFSNGSKLLDIMEVGIWDIAGKPLFLQKWHTLIRLEKAKITSVPIWVRLYNVPHVLWTKIGLSYVCNVLGRPLYMDKVTEQKRRLSHARVCILMGFNSSFPDKFNTDMGHDEFFKVTVDYSWIPLKCKTCNCFGHKDCTAGSKVAWAPKGKSPGPSATMRPKSSTDAGQNAIVPPGSAPSTTPNNNVSVAPPTAPNQINPFSSDFELVGGKKKGSYRGNSGTLTLMASGNRFALLAMEVDDHPNNSSCSIDLPRLDESGLEEPPDRLALFEGTDASDCHLDIVRELGDVKEPLVK